jgi:2-dehydro-3-deoxygluconokinase
MTGNPLVVTLGEVMLRLSPPPGRRIENADTLRVHVAGAEANVSAALARLGLRSRLITALPDSPLGHRAAGELAAAGVELSGVQWCEGARMGTFFVEQGAPPRATSVWYDRAGSAFAEAITWPPGALAGARAAVLSGITPALSPAAREAATAFAAEAVASGVLLCIDVNHRERLWLAEQARETLAPLLAQADIVVCAERDARSLFGAEAEAPAVLRERWAPNASICVITRGEHGCSAVSERTGQIDVDAVPTTLVDRLGIGDAFVAGFLRSVLADEDLVAALRAGAALAALKATVSGDLSLARAGDLDAFLDQRTPSQVNR